MTEAATLETVLAAAQAEVRAVDWTTWQVPPGDARVADSLFADQPPLTNGLVVGYLNTCSWIWQRPLAPAEQSRAASALIVLWVDKGSAMDYGPLLDVLSLTVLPNHLQGLALEEIEAIRQELLARVPDGHFPGIDGAVPGADAAAAVAEAEHRAAIPASDLASPADTGFALDGLYSATTFGLQLDITGPPGSGTWGSTTEFYAFFPDGSYLYFPSASEVGRQIDDPAGHRAPNGRYEVSGSALRLYDADDGQTNTSDFTASPDRSKIAFFGKDFTRIGETVNLRPRS
jgi:hypothetical protein